MSVLLFLNELSCGTPQSPSRVDEAMEHFVSLLRYVKTRRNGASLVSPVPREHLELAQGYHLSQWLGSRPRNRDLWRSVQSMRNQAPFSQAVPRGVAEVFEVSVNDRVAEGARAAHLMNGILVSLLVDPAWNTSWIDATCSEVTETADDQLGLDTYPVTIRHAATSGHAAEHDGWLTEVGLRSFRTGAEIWEARGDLYPNLQFLDAVRDHLYELREDWVIPVAYRLRTLDSAIEGWDPLTSTMPDHLGSKVTPEAEQRKRLCYFTDLDGRSRLFDLHARFTPGAGRVHLRLVGEDRKIRIAYIGPKIMRR